MEFSCNETETKDEMGVNVMGKIENELFTSTRVANGFFTQFVHFVYFG